MTQDNPFERLRSDDGRAKLAEQLISRLRTKLLDLTARNPLLNYRHSDRARAQIRVIDELPDVVHARLGEGKALAFRALKESSGDFPDEQTDEFQIALEAARLEDPEYLDGLKGLPSDDSSDPAVLRLERQLCDRIRVRLGLSPRPSRATISPADSARHEGLNPTYELPVQGTSQEDRHLDDEIQTLLFPDRMEARLSALREGARRALEETGINTLFAAYGFLEWYESRDSDKPLYAPLFLQPLEMERVSQRGRWRYFVRGAGEDSAANVTLAERMKRDYSLEWPQAGEDETPETYFSKVAEVVREQERWRVRRFVTFGLFAFGRLAMWHDLDPARWMGSSPATNSVVAALLSGGGSGEGLAAEEHDVDAPAVVKHIPPLIRDADSSQLSAILDATAGKNLAIKGPPGTGKSQTIANMIAAAMFQGKSVLFVAEKMAALSVVKSRLDDAGLGHFVLELHSTKARRKDVLNSLAGRLEYRAAPVPADLERERAELAGLRDQLNEYVKLLNSSFGGTGKTIQEILWASQRTRGVDLPDRIERVVLPGAESLATGDLERIQSLLDAFEVRCREVVARWGRPEQHPWAWVGRVLSPFEAEDLVEAVREWRSLVEALRPLMGEASDALQVQAIRRADLEVLSLAVQKIPKGLPREVSARLVRRLADPRVREGVGRMCELLATRETVRERWRPLTRMDFEMSRRPLVVEAVKGVHELGLGQRAVGELPQLIGGLIQERERWRAVERAVDGFGALFGVDGPRSPGVLATLLDAADLIASTPREAVARRRKALDGEEARMRLDRAARDGSRLRDAHRGLLVTFDLAQVSRVEEVKAAAKVLREVGVLGRLRRPYRQARALWRGGMRRPVQRTREGMSRDLDRIAEHLEQVKAFETDSELGRMLGGYFEGVHTDFDSLVGAATFMARSQELGQSQIPDRIEIAVEKQVRRLLTEGETAVLERIRGFVSGEAIPMVRSAVEAMRQDTLGEAREMGERLDREVATLKGLARDTEHLALASHLPLSRLDDLIHDFDLLQGIEAERQALAQALPPLAGTDPESVQGRMGISVALEFAEELSRVDGPLAGDIKRYLFDDDVEQRLRTLHATGQRLSIVLSAESSAKRSVVALAGIGEDWPGEGHIDVLGDVLGSSLADVDALGEWCDYARLRNEVVAEGAEPILVAYGEDVPLHDLSVAYGRAFWRTLARRAFEQRPALLEKSGSGMTRARERLREIDRRMLDLNRREIAASVSRRPIRQGNGVGPRSEWTDLALIRHQTQLQRPRIVIRDLVKRARHAMPALKPCWMMSPISVAQFVEPGAVEFDLVIVDEASQMRPEEAVGAVGRGRQLVVVGDPMQLPPTTFFDRMETFDDEALGDDIEEESILDLALGQFQPFRDLRWHYRSRHESLIRFSNREFYDNKLIAFPSPTDQHGALGVWHHKVDGVYRGRGGNPDEVQQVAAAAIEAMGRYPQWSLGVVAVNLEQAELLRMEIDRLLLRHQKAREYVTQWEGTLEPFFVKNLENVQGDERDMIVISTVYGPNERGQVLQRFGPINQKMGHRRLNVLFTRAKYRVDVYTSLAANQIRTDDGASWGVRALKGYLEYAATRRLESGVASGREPDSDFELEVGGALRSRGYEVTAQVGVDGFFIDLGVKHDEYPHGYLAGIECDGATYHSSKSAKDRDILRQEALESLGWRLYRVWSTDWFSNRARELERLLEFLEELRRREPGADPVENVTASDNGEDRPSDAGAVEGALPRSSVTQEAVPFEKDRDEARAGSSSREKLIEIISQSLPPQEARCRRCGAIPQLRIGPFGPYVKCAACGLGVPVGTGALNDVLQRIGVTCRGCGAAATAARGPRGSFIGCSQYRQCGTQGRSWLELRDELR